jgi:hypothetical protein
MNAYGRTDIRKQVMAIAHMPFGSGELINQGKKNHCKILQTNEQSTIIVWQI